jgi:hypothetical protein
MGIFDIIFGGSSKPRVTEKEFKKVRSDLMFKGMSRKRRDKVSAIFSGDMYEKATSTHPKGIEKDEIDERVKWMRENKSKHGLSDHEITEVEASLRKRL